MMTDTLVHMDIIVDGSNIKEGAGARRKHNRPSSFSTASTSLPVVSTRSSPIEQSKSLQSSPQTARASRRISSRKKIANRSSPDLGASNPPRESSRTLVTMSRSGKASYLNAEVTYTPTTHRVSKALKGKRVHKCSMCEKVYTRKEHLERHKLNHDPVAKFPCKVASCSKKFQREDLLMRHMEKNDMSHRRVYEAIMRERRRVSPGRATFGDLSPSGSMPYDFTGTLYPSGYAPYPVASQDIATLLAAVGTSAPSYESSLAEPITPEHYSLTTSVSNPNIMYPITISSHSQAFPCSYPPPDLSYGPSDESPIYSAPDSPFSPDYLQQSFHSAGPALPTRNRAASVPSTQSWAPLSKTPLSECSSIPTSWNIDEAVTASSVTGTSFEVGSFLTLGIPPASNFSQESTATASTSALRVAILKMNALQASELRRLTRASELSRDLFSSPLVERLEECMELYWRHFDPFLPIVHRPTFLTREVSPLLIVSMAIMGAQYGNWDAINFAMNAHQATKELLATREPASPSFTTSEMQATVLIEMFAYYRSRRIDIQPSIHFRTLYSRLLRTQSLFNDTRSDTSESRDNWLKWVDLESQRRVMLAAYHIDAQQATLFEQEVTDTLSLELNYPIPCPNAFWESTSASEWNVVTPTEASEHRLTLQDVTALASLRFELQPTLSPFTSSLVVSYFSIQRRQQRGSLAIPIPNAPPSAILLAHTQSVLALVPLRSLLAVAGLTWVLGQKMTDGKDFARAKSAVRQWAMDRPTSLRAAWHAAHVLRIAFNHGVKDGDLHERWCIYVSGLVCWAFVCAHQQHDIDIASASSLSEEQATWEFLTALDKQSWELVVSFPQRWQALALLRWIRRKVSGSGSGLLGDAEGVLGKLGEGGIGDLF